MIDERTSNLNLPLPHPDNQLSVDVARLRQALSDLDAALSQVIAVAGSAVQTSTFELAQAQLADVIAVAGSAIQSSAIGAPNGVTPLDSQGLVPTVYLPEVLFGAVKYQGGWNASTNTPAIPAASAENKGHYYIVQVAGSTNIDGTSTWVIGDWIISDGATWDRIANSEVFDASAIQTGVFDAARIPALPISRITSLQAALDGKQASLGFTPVQQGGGANQATNKLYFGWDGSGLRYQVDATDRGRVWDTSNFNPASYMPLAGGNFSGNFGIYNTSPTVMFYDTDWGPRQLHCNGGLIGFLNSGGGWAVYSDNDGNLVASGNVGAYSDRKHKKRIRPIKSAIDLIKRLRGVRYTDKRTGAERVGVIAQEVQEHLPEVVGKGKDGLHVDYGNIVAPLIEAVKELDKRLTKLEGR